MQKPRHLEKGDCVAIVSLSSGILGEDWAIHKLHIARERLEHDYGLRVKVMPNALKGSRYLYEHPEARAADWMDAFRDRDVKAIFNAIGGDDAIRLLPIGARCRLDAERKTPRSSPAFPTPPPTIS